MTQPLSIAILSETPDYLIVEKPAGMVVHPDAHNKTGTFIQEIVKLYPDVARIGDQPNIRPGLVQRLDKVVSGVMLIARTQNFFEFAKNQFMTREVDKKYHALTFGAVSKDDGEIIRPIGRKQHGKMAARTVPRSKPTTSSDTEAIESQPAGKPAITSYSVIERYQHYTYLEVRPLTGRTHQIRVHLLAIGHPILGDTMYRTKKFHVHEKNMKKRFPFLETRICLHAYSLSFTNLTGKRQTFTSPIPDDMMKIIEYLRSK